MRTTRSAHSTRRRYDEANTSSDSRRCRRRDHTRGRGRRASDWYDHRAGHRPHDSTTHCRRAGARGRHDRAARARATPGSIDLPSVAAGQIRLRVLRLGYEAETRTVTVGANETVTADFVLGATATRLDQVVVSATGESELRRESGNNIATINVDSIPKTVINGVTDLLSSRAANVVVTQTSGTTGGGSRIRIRGSNSLSLSNEPLIIIDGVRAISDVSGSTDRHWRTEPESPRRSESGRHRGHRDHQGAGRGRAVRHGCRQRRRSDHDARGRAGTTKWTAFADGGSVRDVTAYPANFGAIGLTSSATPRRTTGCSLDSELVRPLHAEGGLADQLQSAGAARSVRRRLSHELRRERGRWHRRRAVLSRRRFRA